MNRLLLIDDRVHDIQTVVKSLLPVCDHIVINFMQDSIATLVERIPNKKYESVALFQENYETMSYQFLASCNLSALKNVENNDPELNSWNDFKNLLAHLRDHCGSKHFDMMGCNIGSNNDWKYVMNGLENKLNIKIESSSDLTGAGELGGNWILESSNENMIGKYFTEEIKEYKFVLGGNSFSQTSFWVDKNGHVWTWGDNKWGQAGIGNTNSIYDGSQIPSKVLNLSNIISVKSGFQHTLFFDINRNIYGCGTNGYAQLPINNTNLNTVTLVPTEITFFKNNNIKIISIACTGFVSFFLEENGDVWACGPHNYGGFGNEFEQRETYYLVPQKIPFFTNNNIKIKNIYSGHSHQFFLDISGNYYASGGNSDGQLGLSNVYDYLGGVLGLPVISPILKNLNIKSIWGGLNHSIFLDNSGNVYTCGANYNGQLGLGDKDNRNIPTLVPTLKNINKIAGSQETVALDTSGNIYQAGPRDGPLDMTLVNNVPKNIISISSSLLCTTYLDSSFNIYVNRTKLSDNINTGFINGNIGMLGEEFLTLSEFFSRGYTVSQLRELFSTSEFKGVGYTAANLYDASFSAKQLYDASYTALEMYDSSYTLIEMRVAGYSVTQLRTAPYTNQEIITSGYTVQQLRLGGYNVVDLKNNFSVQELRLGGFTASQMKTELFLAAQLKEGGYSASQVFNAGYTLSEMRAGGYTAGELRSIGITATELRNSGGYTLNEKVQGGYNATQLRAAGYSAEELKVEGFTASQLRVANFSASDLRRALYTLSELKTGGYTPTQLKIAQYTLQQMKDVGFTALELRTAFTLLELKNIGFTPKELKAGNFTASNLNGVGFTAIQMRLDASGVIVFSATEMRAGDYVASELKQGGYTASELKSADFLANQLSATIVGFTAKELTEGGYPLSDIVGLYNVTQLRDASYSGITLRDYPVSLTRMILGFSVTELRDLEYTALALKTESVTLDQLISGNYNATELKAANYSALTLRDKGFTLVELIAGGYSAPELKAANYTASNLRNDDGSFNLLELIAGGYNAENLRDASYSALTLRTADFNLDQLIEGKYTVQELKDANYTAKQLKEKSYTLRQLLNVSYTIQNIYDASFTANELYTLDVSASLLLNIYDLQEIRLGDYSAKQIKDSGVVPAITIVAMLDAGYIIEKLREGGYLARDVKLVLNDATNDTVLQQLKRGKYNATELKDASYNATQLKGVGFSATQLRTAEFKVIDLIEALFTATQMKEAGYSALELINGYREANPTLTNEEFFEQLVELSYSARDLRDAGYDASGVYNAGYPKTAMFDASYTTTELKVIGDFNIQVLAGLGFTAKQMKDAPFQASEISLYYTLAQLLVAPYSIQNLRDASFTASNMKAENVLASDLLAGNVYSPVELKEGGYTAKNLKDAGVLLATIVQIAYTVENMRDAEYLASDLIPLLTDTSGNSIVKQLKDGKYTATELKASNVSLAELLGVGYTLVELKEAGYGPKALNDESVPLADLKNIASFTASEFKEDSFGAADLEAIDFTARELRDASFAAVDLIVPNLLYTPLELRDASYSATDLKGLLTLAVLKNDASFTATELRAAPYDLAELVAVSFNVSELREALYTAVELDEYFTLVELKAGGVTVREMIENLPQEETEQAITFQYAKDVLGYTSEEFYDSGYDASDLLTATNMSTTELLAGGFDIEPTPSVGGSGGDAGAV